MKDFYIDVLTDTLHEKNYISIDFKLTGKSAGDIDHISKVCDDSHMPIELHMFRRCLKDISNIWDMLCYVEILVHTSHLVISSVHCPEKINQPQLTCLGCEEAGRNIMYNDLDTLASMKYVSNYMNGYYEEESDVVNLMHTILFAELASIVGLNNPDISIGSRKKVLSKIKELHSQDDTPIKFMEKLLTTIPKGVIHTPVVIHSSNSIPSLINMNLSDKSSVLNSLQLILTKFPHIDIAIENTTPLRTATSKFNLSDTGNPLIPAMIVQKLQKELEELYIDKNRVGTVFDYCHYLICCDFMHSKEHFPLEDVLKMQKNICKVIHLADKIGIGVGKQHGVHFNEEDHTSVDRLIEFIEAYCAAFANVNNTPIIVLEVREESYPSVINRERVVKLLKDTCYVKVR